MSDSEFFSKSDFSFTDTFTDIRKVYSSVTGHTEIYEAMKALKRFALKALKPEFRKDPFYIGLLRKEFEIGFRLEHPNIVHTYSFEEVEGLGPCIVLERIEGESMAENIANHSLSDEEWQNVLIEICDALEYLEARQIVHRDIKPSNVMLTTDGKHAKLIDFGFADSPEYGTHKHSGGTKAYAAPEQTDTSERPITHLSDIYSFGKLLQAVPMAKSKKADILIEEMLSENPAARPQNIRALKKSLQKTFMTSGWNRVTSISAIVLFLCLLIIVLCLTLFHGETNGNEPMSKVTLSTSDGPTVLATDVHTENDAEVDKAPVAPAQHETVVENPVAEQISKEEGSKGDKLIGDYSGGGYIYSEDYPILMELKINKEGKVSARYKHNQDYIWTQMRGRIDRHNIKIEHIPDPEADFEMTMKFDYIIDNDRLELSGYAEGPDGDREKVYVVLRKRL